MMLVTTISTPERIGLGVPSPTRGFKDYSLVEHSSGCNFARNVFMG